MFGDANTAASIRTGIAAAPDVEVLGEAAGATMLLVPRNRIQAVSVALREAGATTVVARKPDYVFEAANDMLARVLSRVDDRRET